MVKSLSCLTCQEALSWFVGADWEQYLSAITPLLVGACMTTFQCDVVKACWQVVAFAGYVFVNGLNAYLVVNCHE